MTSPALRPLIVGIGGAAREGSSTNRVLAASLARAAELGCETRMFEGAFLARLPIYEPGNPARCAERLELVETVARADGVIVASPGYHGSISGLVKNALDTLEDLRDDKRPYFHGRAVGTIITADGWQAAGGALTALRQIIHAMRGWPTPFGAALNASGLSGELDEKDAWQLTTVAEQVVEFARLRAPK